MLKDLDETENSLDSDGEGVKPAGSPIPFLDSDLAVTVQKDVCTKKLSRNNSDAEEEPEEDTVDLELALERKKVGISWSSITTGSYFEAVFVFFKTLNYSKYVYMKFMIT